MIPIGIQHERFGVEIFAVLLHFTTLHLQPLFDRLNGTGSKLCHLDSVVQTRLWKICNPEVFDLQYLRLKHRLRSTGQAYMQKVFFVDYSFYCPWQYGLNFFFTDGKNVRLLI